MTDQTTAEQRGQQSLVALADEDAEVEAAVTDRLMDDIETLGDVMTGERFDGLG